MKINIFLAAFGGIGAAVVTAGCVSTVAGTHDFGVPLADSVEGRYERTLDQVYGAALQVVNNNGVLVTEYIPHNTTNSVRALEARIDKEDVYMQVEAVDPQITQVTVQARTMMGGDVEEAHELEKDIALQLDHE